MKTIREVTEITGITRRALQGYDEVGLLHPTAKTQGGYWLYNDSSVNQIMNYSILIEAGYTRKELLELINSNLVDYEDVLDNAIKKLEDKRDKIENLLYYYSAQKKVIQGMPIDLVNKISNKLEVNDLHLNLGSLGISKLNSGDFEKSEFDGTYLVSLYVFYIMMLLVNLEMSDDLIQDLIKQLFIEYKKLVIQMEQDTEDYNEDILNSVSEEEWLEIAGEAFTDEEYLEDLDGISDEAKEVFNPKAVSKFKDAIRYFLNKKGIEV